MHHAHKAKLTHAMPDQLVSQGSILLASQGDNLSPFGEICAMICGMNGI